MGNSTHDHRQLRFQPKQTTTNRAHLSRHIIDMAPTVTHYRDHHKMIKAIEKCSLQATFGPEITSTGELLPKEYNVSSVKASHDSDFNPVEKRTRFNKISFFSARPRIKAGLLPMDPIDEGDNIGPDLMTNDGSMPIVLTNQDGNIPSKWSTNCGSMAPISTREDGVAPFRQSNFFGRVPLEIWGQKVSYHACASSSLSFANTLPVVRLKSFASGPARIKSIATSMTYLTQITSIQITTGCGTQRTFSASAVPRTL